MLITNTSIIMSDLIKDLLALTYAEHGKLEIEHVSLNVCFNTAIQLLISEVNETGTQIESDQLSEVKITSVFIMKISDRFFSYIAMYKLKAISI